MSLKGAPSTRVAIPQGSVYPSGIGVVTPDANIQGTVRPAGSLFVSSTGFRTVRPGRHRFQAAYYGLGIGFTPMRFAEDLSDYENQSGVPALVTQDEVALNADIANIPGSENLDSGGSSTDPDAVRTYVGQGTDMPVHDGASDMHSPLRTVPDMGDRQADRPLTREYFGFGQKFIRNPVGAFRGEYGPHPVVAVIGAAAITAGVYVIARDFERSYGSRRGRGVASAAAAAPAAGVETAAREARRATDVAAEATESAAEAVKTAGKEVEAAATEVADAATE